MHTLTVDWSDYLAILEMWAVVPWTGRGERGYAQWRQSIAIIRAARDRTLPMVPAVKVVVRTVRA